MIPGERRSLSDVHDSLGRLHELADLDEWTRVRDQVVVMAWCFAIAPRRFRTISLGLEAAPLVAIRALAEKPEEEMEARHLVLGVSSFSAMHMSYSAAVGTDRDLLGSSTITEVRRRDEPFNTRIGRTPLPVALGAVADVAPIHEAGGSVWLLLTEQGQLVRFDAGTGECVSVAKTDLRAEPERNVWNNRLPRRRLTVSPLGEFAAVVTDYGRYGQVLDLSSGRPTMALDGGDYLPETVPFSLTFAEVRGRTILVHRTDWNRLDISDPATGKLLTARGPTSYRRGEQQPEHYLDFFHGALHVSPESKRILDDGWVWHPIGVPTTWCIEPWLSENAWESEDGPSKLDLCARDEWDQGATWIDDQRLAISRLGDEDDKMSAGARVFDASSVGPPGPNRHDHGRWARELIAFPGPAGSFFSDGTWLFSSDPSGLSRWDPGTGELTGQIPGFEARWYHRGARELAQITDQTLVRVSLL